MKERYLLKDPRPLAGALSTPTEAEVVGPQCSLSWPSPSTGERDFYCLGLILTGVVETDLGIQDRGGARLEMCARALGLVSVCAHVCARVHVCVVCACMLSEYVHMGAHMCAKYVCICVPTCTCVLSICAWVLRVCMCVYVWTDMYCLYICSHMCAEYLHVRTHMCTKYVYVWTHVLSVCM